MSFLVMLIGAEGTIAWTASPPSPEAGPSPTKLNAITLTRTAVP